MHASYVPAPPPPPEPPKVLRTVPPPTMAARNGHLAGCPPNPPLLAFPRRGPGSNAGPPAPPAPRAPPTVPSGQPLYCVSRIQPPPPSSAPRQMRTGLLPAPNNATFPGSRRGPPPPPPLTEQETRGGGDPFLSRPSGAAGGRGIRAPDPKRALSQFPFHQAEAMHIAQGAHAAPRDDASLHLSSCGVPAYVQPLHSATDSSPGGVPSQVLQGSSTSSAEFLRHQHGNVDHNCEDSGFASVDITGGPRGISSPQNQPRVLLPPEPRRPTEQVPVVLVLHPKRGDSSDSSKWPSERQPYRDYNADHAFENGGSRRNSTHGSHDSPNRLTHPPEEDRQAFDLLSRDSMPTGFHTMEEGVPTTSTRRRLSQLSPRRVHSASAADWKSVASSDSPRVSRELSPGSVGTDASRKESALSPAFNSRAQWHPPSQLTPSPCSLSLARLPPSPITPFGVVGHQRSQGIDPSVPTEGRPPEPSPPDASPVQRRSLDGGRGSHAQKRTRDLPGADVPRPLPPAPPVVLNVGGRLSHSQRAFEHEAAKPDSRPRTERQRRRKQRQQQRRQRARRRQQPQQQEPYTEESPQRETPRDSPSACGHTEEEQESFSRGDQAATTTFYPPPFVHRFSNLSDSTDSEQDGERTAEGDREEESDPWAASLEDVERHLKRRKALHSGTGHDFSHFPVGLQWDPRSKPSSDCPMLQNCDELFLPPWREQQRGTSGRIIYQFELLQHRPFRALWNSTAVDVSSSPSPFAQHHAVRSKASSPARELRSLAHGARSQDSSGEAERTALFQENVGRGAGGRSAALPRDHLDSAYVRSGPIDRGHQRRAGEARGVPSRGPGSSCSNSSRRTSMSLGGDGEQWGGAERTCESDKPETFFWESEKCQRFVMTSSTRAPTEGDGSTDDSGFHHGFSSGKGDERNKQPLRRGSDTGRSPGCHEPQPKCWWGDQTPNAEARRNSLHEKDGGSSMMLPHVPWC